MKLLTKLVSLLACIAVVAGFALVSAGTPAVSAAGTTISGYWSATATGSGTWSQQEEGPVLTGGSISFTVTLTGGISATKTASFNVLDLLGGGEVSSGLLTGVLEDFGGTDHTGQAWFKNHVPTFAIDVTGNPSPGVYTFYWSFDMVTSPGDSYGLTDDGLYSGGAQWSGTIAGTGTLIDLESWTWTCTGSGSGTWSAEIYNWTGGTLTPVEAHTSGTLKLTTTPARVVAALHYDVQSAGSILLGHYQTNPGGPLPKLSKCEYIEVGSSLPESDINWPLELRIYYTDDEVAAAGVDESTLKMYTWDGSSWTVVADTGIGQDADGKYVYGMLTHFSPHVILGDPAGAGVSVYPTIYAAIAGVIAVGAIGYLIRRKVLARS